MSEKIRATLSIVFSMFIMFKKAFLTTAKVYLTKKFSMKMYTRFSYCSKKHVPWRGDMETVDFSGVHSHCLYSFQGFQHDDTVSSYYLRKNLKRIQFI